MCCYSSLLHCHFCHFYLTSSLFSPLFTPLFPASCRGTALSLDPGLPLRGLWGVADPWGALWVTLRTPRSKSRASPDVFTRQDTQGLAGIHSSRYQT